MTLGNAAATLAPVSPIYLGAIATLIGAFIGLAANVAGEKLRYFFFHPELEVSTENGPPCSVMVPMTNPSTGEFLRLALFLRIFVRNVGNVTARNVEVYAERLYRIGPDGCHICIKTFPPMNLTWANAAAGQIHVAIISPDMGRYCDVCYTLGPLADPEHKSSIPLPTGAASASSLPAFSQTSPQSASPFEAAPAATPELPTSGDGKGVALTTAQQLAGMITNMLLFSVHSPPNHFGHQIASGTYLLELLVAAENCRPILCTLEIFHLGGWSDDENEMLRAFDRMKVLRTSNARGRESVKTYLFGRWPRETKRSLH